MQLGRRHFQFRIIHLLRGKISQYAILEKKKQMAEAHFLKIRVRETVWWVIALFLTSPFLVLQN